MHEEDKQPSPRPREKQELLFTKLPKRKRMRSMHRVNH